MIPAIALVLVVTLGGTIATYAFDRAAPAYARLATGALIGLTALGFIGFVLALLLGMTPVSQGIAAAVALAPVLLLRSPSIRTAVRRDLEAARDRLGSIARPSSRGLVTVAYGLAIAVGAWLVADRTLFEQADGLYIGNVNNLGDLPYHLQITASFAYGDNFPPQNPVFAGSGFSYHYIADFLAAVFVAVGTSLRDGMLILTVTAGLALLALIHRWTRDLTGSAVAARIAPLLLAFSGGLGWLVLFDEARRGESGLVAAFAASDARYTIDPEGFWRFGNAITTLLIPQRGLLLGMGLAVIVFTLLWQHLNVPDEPASPTATWRRGLRDALTEPRMVVAGVLTGVLPMVHIHTFAVVGGTAFLWCIAFREWRAGRWLPWVVYVASTMAVAVPLLAWTARGSQASISAFFGLELGWDHGAHPLPWFWLANTGAFIPAFVAALLWRGDRPLVPRRLLLYALPFVVWFIVPNVLRLAPWLWDNIKVLVYWWLGGVPIVALLLARLWSDRTGPRIAAVALAVVLMAAGALDVARATVGPSYQEFDRDGMALASLIREETPPNAVILTAPAYNTPVFLTGRRVFMGYVGHLWSNGLPYGDRERDVRTIYAGEAGARELLARYGISYVVVGPQERREVAANDAFFEQFPVVGEAGEYRLYEVPNT